MKDKIEKILSDAIMNGEEVDITARKIYEQVVKPIGLMKENKVQFAKAKCKEQRENCEHYANSGQSFGDMRDAPEPEFN